SNISIESSPLSMSPEIIQVVVRPGLIREQVDDHVDKVDENPRLSFVSVGVNRLGILLLTQLDDLVGDGSHLPSAGAGSQNKVITHRRDPTHVENDDMATP